MQEYCPASTSCTPWMCSVPRCSSCSTKGAEPTSSSPENWSKEISPQHRQCEPIRFNVWLWHTFEPVNKRRRNTCGLTLQSSITSNGHKYILLYHCDSGNLWGKGFINILTQTVLQSPTFCVNRAMRQLSLRDKMMYLMWLDRKMLLKKSVYITSKPW